jgi:hypothetical protein
MRQALHIFKKDVRYLRYELTLVTLFTLAFAVMHFHAAHNGLFSDTWLPEVCLFIGLATLIGRLILAEPIPGDRQFWITRPYRWKSLLAAKLLFILAFLNLPIFLAQVVILMADGFPIVSNLPGLLWSQVLLLVFALPFVAFATLSSIKPFQLILFAMLAGFWGLGTVQAGGPVAGTAWVGASFALILLFVTATAPPHGIKSMAGAGRAMVERGCVCGVAMAGSVCGAIPLLQATGTRIDNPSEHGPNAGARILAG